MNKYIDEVIADFDELYPDQLWQHRTHDGTSTGIRADFGVRENLKDFLKAALTEQERRIKEELLAKLGPDKDISKHEVGSVGDYHTHGYNECWDKIKSLLTSLPSSTEE